MKYALALIASLMATSVAIETSFNDSIDSQDLNISFENVKTAAEATVDAVKKLFSQYNPFVTNEHSIVSNATDEAIDIVSTALPVNDSSESSLFTTLKTYVVTRPYKIGVATVTATAALVGTALYVYSETIKKNK